MSADSRHLSLTVSAAAPGWVADVLPGYEALTLPLLPDDEGEVVATLVRRRARGAGQVGERAYTASPANTPPTAYPVGSWWNRGWQHLARGYEAGKTRRAPTPADDHHDSRVAAPDAGVDVLYIHGWVDYFHQEHVADFFESLGARFYALDLRKYGRSLREHQKPGFIADLKTYDEEIEAALAVMGHRFARLPRRSESDLAPPGAVPASRAARPAKVLARGLRARGASSSGGKKQRQLVLLGHSTGGLVLALWASRNPGRADALILNAPWLEFQTRSIGRKVLEAPVRAQAALAPRSPIVNPDQGFYARTLSARLEGEWNYNEAWRPDRSWTPTPAWLAAVFAGHEAVAQGLGITVPIMVLISARSILPLRWSPELHDVDQVLNVPETVRRVPNLGSLVTLAKFEGALHDVFLSREPVRNAALNEVARWLRGYVLQGDL